MPVRSMKIPAVTIGVPVYNGEPTIHRAIQSALEQTFDDFELVISNNGSTDATGEICEHFQRIDPRIRHVSHPVTRDAAENFRYLIENSEAPYFVFLAADDYWDRNFLSKTKGLLDKSPSTVAAGSRTLFEKIDDPGLISSGTFPVSGSVFERLKTYLHNPCDNSRFYSLFRAVTLKRAFRSELNFHASDWYIMAITLLDGHHLEVPEVLLYRTYESSDKYLIQFLRDRRNLHEIIFPLFPLIKHIRKMVGAKLFVKLIPTLARLNFRKSWELLMLMHSKKLRIFPTNPS